MYKLRFEIQRNAARAHSCETGKSSDLSAALKNENLQSNRDLWCQIGVNVSINE